ncbi:MAG: hypothetical protein NC541_09305 [bacterium]|nr:hypothetical protein [bacterium]
MTDLLKNAWNGWHDFTDTGKLAALLLISLLFLWIYYKRVEQKTFLIYATVTSICCMIPVTAVWLMLYQTRFYDYEWIWSIVPVTAAVGYGATVFITDFLKELSGGDRKKAAAAVAGLLVMTLLCGGMGTSPWDSRCEREEEQYAKTLIPQLREHMADRQISLWAPREILEYTREQDATIRLLYGRNMWDESLNAYVYGGYSQEYESLYDWMERTESEPISAPECAEILINTDVNCILLPEDTEEETVECFEETLGMSREKLGKYYLLIR